MKKLLAFWFLINLLISGCTKEECCVCLFTGAQKATIEVGCETIPFHKFKQQFEWKNKCKEVNKFKNLEGCKIVYK